MLQRIRSVTCAVLVLGSAMLVHAGPTAQTVGRGSKHSDMPQVSSGTWNQGGLTRFDNDIWHGITLTPAQNRSLKGIRGHYQPAAEKLYSQRRMKGANDKLNTINTAFTRSVMKILSPGQERAYRDNVSHIRTMAVSDRGWNNVFIWGGAVGDSPRMDKNKGGKRHK